MKYFLIILFLVIVALLCYGFYIKPIHFERGEFCIGSSIALLFFLWMPLFIYHRWKGKNVKDYMLTQENIEKMRQEGEKKNL